MQDPHSSRSSEIARPTAIVGIGCAAGGIDAIESILKGLPEGLGAALVIVQHLNTGGSDILLELIAPMSRLTVTVLDENPAELVRDHIYVFPQRSVIRRSDDGIAAVREEHPDQRATVIDGLFRVIAETSQVPTVGIVLSGSGSDGTLGLAAIRDAGGLTIVQNPESASHVEMPQNAAPAADLILSPEELSRELAAHIEHIQQSDRTHAIESRTAGIEASLPQICDALLAATEYEFRHYEKQTLIRRVSRRMQVLRINNADDYLHTLQAAREEAHALFRELLVSVTAFFRDPDTFVTLAQLVLPKLFERRIAGEPIRIWVPACATGQEAYTLAMLMIEERDRHDRDIELQIYATDIDQRALNVAREGSYPASIADELTEQRLNRFFRKVGKRYVVNKTLRDICVFSVHNLISDPPFSQMDLISCRNLLIYLGRPLQLKLIPLFHFALRPQGYLLLGPSENLTSHTEIFRPVDRQHRISQRKAGPARPGDFFADGRRMSGKAVRLGEESPNEHDIHRISQRIVLDEFAPRYAVVNEDGHLVCTSTGLARYFEFPDGPFANNVMKIAKSGLRSGLRAALREAKESLRTVVREGLTLRTDEGVQQVQLTCQPMPEIGEDAGLFMLVFQERGAVVWHEGADDSIPDAEAAIERLERELDQTRTDLESTVQDLEGSNEELKSSNEELRSLNEELQSANEELETSKEEINTGMEALSRARSDLQNLLDGTRIATIFLDAKGNINSFTPTVRDIYNVRETDVGRPLSEITHKAFAMPPIPAVDSLTGDDEYVEDEIQTSESRWFLRRVLPYRYEDQADGVILTFVDVSEKKRDEMRLAAAYSVTQLLVEAESFEEAVPQLLESLRETLNAEVCSLWILDDRSRSLYCSNSSIRANAPLLSEFTERNKDWRFEAGAGLPGRVWKTLEPLWIEDVTSTAAESELHFERQGSATQAGLVSGIALPILSGKRFRGVIEFFANRTLEFEQSLLNMLRDVGHEIGQFIRRKKLDDRLRDEEARRSAILAAALDCIVTMDMEGNIVDFNDAAETTFGMSRKNVAGKPLAEVLIPEELRVAHRDGMSRYLQTGTSDIVGTRVELTAQRADGTQFPIELAINVSHNRDGSPFFTGYLRDITERKSAEEVLHQRAQLAALHASLALTLAGESPLIEVLQACCQKLVDGLGAAIARVWLVDEQEQVLHLSAGAGLDEHFDDARRRIPVGDLKIGRIAAQRRPFLTNDVPHDPNMGDPEWARREGMIAFAGYPLIVENRVVGVVALFAKRELAPEVYDELLPMADAVAQCIARKKSEQELLDRERKLNLALDAGRLGTWHWDVVTDHVTWSQQLYELFGYTKDQFIQTRAGFLDILHPDDRDRVTEQLDTAFNGTCETYEMEFRIIRGDDQRTVWTFGCGVIHRDEHNNPLSIVAVANDATDRKQWELELSDREAHLRRVIDHTLNFVGVLDTDGIVLEINQTALTAGALSRDDVIGKAFQDCYWWNFDEDSMTRLQDSVRRAATGEVVRYDVVVRMAGDTRMTIDYMLSPVRDESGRITHLIPSGVDISDRKTAENLLRRREAHITFLSDLQTELSPLESADRISQVAAKRIADYLELSRCVLVDLDELAATAHAFHDHCRDHLPSLVGTYDMANYFNDGERRQLVDGGSLVLNDTHTETSSAAAADHFDALQIRAIVNSAYVSDQRLEFMLTAVKQYPYTWRTDEVELLRNLSENVYLRIRRARAEEALRQSEERLKMAIQAGGMAVWEWNPRESVWTDALYELLGIPTDRTASPELFFERVHPDDVAELKEAWKLATEGIEDYSCEFRIVRPDGEVRWMVGMGEVVRDDDGNVVRVFGLNWDSTTEHDTAEALRESEQKAQLASKSKSEFVANMSHEIRTPMTAVLGYTDLLLAQEDNPEKVEHLRTIQRNGNFLLEIINDILDLSKIEAGKLDILNERFSVVEVVGDIRSMMQVRASEQQLVFRVVFEGTVPERIESDPKRLRQILINLIGNAIKFTKAGSVCLVIREVKTVEGNGIQFDVEDTGIGMTAEQQSRLFQAFSQGDPSVSRSFGGTGLGLAISQRLAVMLGGEITVDSKLGKGSTFTCTIAAGDVSNEKRIRPLLNGSMESCTPLRESSHSFAKPLNCRVLVVDDRREVRFLSNRLLTRAGAEVEEAKDGLEAIERFESNPKTAVAIDLILLDMQMPRLDGYQTAVRLRQLGFTNPIVALTADAMQSDMNRCIEVGCNEYLSKPIDNTKLIETVRRLTSAKSDGV